MASAPQFVTVDSITYQAATVRWVDCTADEGWFSVRVTNLSTNQVTVTSAAADATSLALTGLSGTTAYQVVVIAHSPTLGDLWSAPVTFTTLRSPSAPAAPTNLVASNVTFNSADLSFTDNANDETGFVVTRTTLETGLSTSYTIGANVTSHTSRGLLAGTAYRFEVQAYNTHGTSEAAECFVYTRTQGENPPAAPSNLLVYPTRYNELSFTFQDNSSNEVEFVVDLLLGGNRVGGMLLPFNQVSGSFSGLLSNTDYTVRVRARNLFGESDAIETTGHTWSNFPTIPAAPSDAKALEIGEETVRIVWVNNATNAEEVRLYRKIAAGAYALEATLTPDEAVYIDADLSGVAGTVVNYKLAAWNRAGESAFSNETSVTLTAPVEEDVPPDGVAVVQVDTEEVVVSWRDNTVTEQGFRVEKSTTSSTGPWTTATTVGPNTELAFVSGLSAVETWFRVVAFSSLGDIGTSEVVSITINGDPPAAPSPPTLDVARATGPTSVRVIFTSGDLNTSLFRLRYRVSGDVSWTTASTVEPGVGTGVVESLSPGTTYDFSVRAENAGGSGDSNELSATTTVVEGEAGLHPGGGTAIAFSRSFTKDSDDVTLLAAQGRAWLVTMFRCAPASVANGPFAELFVGEQVISRANPYTGVCEVSDYRVPPEATVTIRFRGSGTTVEAYAGELLLL